MISFADFTASVTAAVHALAAVSMTLKVAWLLLGVWAVVQVTWLRRIRVSPPQPAARKPAARKRAPRKKEAAADGEIAAAVGMPPQAMASPGDSVYR